MNNYSIENIASIINGTMLLKSNGDDKIAHLLFDTRKIIFAETSLFFALKSNKNNGHKYLNDAYDTGIRNFIIIFFLRENFLYENVWRLEENSFVGTKNNIQ